MRKAAWVKLIVNIVTFILVAVVLYFAWPEIVTAWGLLGQVNIWILLLLIPIQIFSYFANGMIVFSYLHGRKQLHDLQLKYVARITLELNFVNHIIPSGGVSGMTYMIWRLRQLGIAGGQATMAQLVRMLSVAVIFITFLAIALIAVTAENTTDSWVVTLSAVGTTAVIAVILFMAYLIGSKQRMTSFARWISWLSNKFVQKITLGKVKKDVVDSNRLKKFFIDIHRDYTVLRSEKQLLLKPLLWALLFVAAELALFATAFWALGTEFNPAVLVIAYGAASIVGGLMVTPGGTGGYELMMITVLTAGGMIAAEASAGVILARVILVLGTLATGYVVYHQAVNRFGSPDINKKSRLKSIVALPSGKKGK
jgi:uncharacterized membrane protein YbhN (UPF0104 family)